MDSERKCHGAHLGARVLLSRCVSPLRKVLFGKVLFASTRVAAQEGFVRKGFVRLGAPRRSGFDVSCMREV
jgi:hypothetical protein